MSKNIAKFARKIQHAYEQALAFHQGEQFAPAIAAYRRVLALDAGHTGALANLASLLRRAGDPAGARVVFERGVAIPGAPAPLWYNYGNLLQELQRPADAEHAFRQALARDPRLYQAATHLARLLAEQQRGEEARALHRQSLAIDPRNPVSLRGLGQLCYEAGELDEAERCYRAAHAQTPDDPRILNALGVVLKDRGQFDDALPLWRRAIELAPDYAIPYNNLGVMLRLMRRPGEALGFLRTAVQLDPRDSTAAGNLAHTLLNLGQTTAAEEVARGVLARDAEGHLMLGFALAHQARVEEAIGAFLRSLEAAPGTTANICNALFASLYTDARAAAEITALHRTLSAQIPPAAAPRGCASATCRRICARTRWARSSNPCWRTTTVSAVRFTAIPPPRRRMI